MRGLLKTRQGAAAGSVYVAGAFAISGLLTVVFLGLPERFLSESDYGGLGVLWTATFLAVQVMWIGISQTLGRYIAEREARSEDAAPVIASVRRVQLALLAVLLVAGIATGSLLSSALFGGDWMLAVAFILAVAAYAPEYFRRGTFSGHRQFARLGALHVAESSSRALLGTVLLLAGVGVAGPAAAIVIAPLAGVLLVRPAPVSPPEKTGEPFSAGEAFRFTAPVLACVAFGQLMMNGGTILVSLLGGPDALAQSGAFFAALVLMRAPQYIMSPAISALLPHASRALATHGVPGLDRFMVRAIGVVGLVGLVMVIGAGVLGEWVMDLVFARLTAERALLVALAALAAFYLLCETISQALFALGRARLAAVGWFSGLPVTAVSMALLGGGLLDRISISLALGAFAAALVQAAFYVATRRSTPDAP